MSGQGRELQLDDNSSAAYIMGEDGIPSLVLKSGQSTDLGNITSVGQGAGRSFGVGLNTKGQVAVAVTLDNGSDTLVLVTPPAQ